MNIKKLKQNYKFILFILVGVLLVTTSVSAWNDLTQHKTNTFETLNSNNNVVLTKRGYDTNSTLVDEMLSDAKFELYKVGDPDIKIGNTYITNEFGEIWVLGLDYGDYYFVEIESPHGYTFDRDDEGEYITKYPFTIVDEETDQPVHVDVVNIRSDSNLEIEKELVNKDGSPLNDYQKELQFTFRVTFGEKINDPNFVDNTDYEYSVNGGTTQTIKNGDTIQLRHGETATFENLPYGIAYSVVEVETQEYEVTSMYSSGTVVGNVHATFTNTLKDNAGYIGLTKLLINKDGSELSEDQLNKSFDFEITFSDNGVYPARIDTNSPFMITSGDIVSLKANESLYIMDLPIGISYEIREMDYSSENYYSQNGLIQGNVGSNGGYFGYTVTNVFDEALDGFVPFGFSKYIVNGNPDDEFEFELTFDVDGIFHYQINNGELQSFVNGDVIKLKGMDTIIFIDVPAGTRYVLVEKSHEDYEARTTRYEGIVVGDLVMLEFWNHGIRNFDEVGKIIVEKEVINIDTDQSFDFILSYDDEIIEFSLKHGERQEFELPAGTMYEIRENDYSELGYVTNIVNGFGTVNNAEVITVRVTNTYDESLEQIIIKGEKTWDVPEEYKDTIPQQIKISLYKNQGQLVEEKIVSVNEDGKWIYEFKVRKYEDGKEIEYFIREEKIDNYIPTYDGFNIKNTYYHPAKYKPRVRKEVLGNNYVDNFSFIFYIEPIGTAPRLDVNTISIKGNGEGQFSEITFTKAGEYRYYIHEYSESSQPFIYDNNYVILTIKTISVDHRIEIESVTYEKLDYKTKYPYAYFENIYKDTPIGPTDPEIPNKPDIPIDKPDSSKPNKPDLPATGVSSIPTNLFGIMISLAGLELILGNEILKLKRKRR